jgi:tetratricopeptide (TPR) repeat protein
MNPIRHLVVATVAGLVAGAALASAARGQAMIDRIHRRSGIDSGQIVGITPLDVTISKNGVQSTIAAEDIEFITFAGEPDGLNSARQALAAGRPADALKTLDGITVGGGDRVEVQTDVEFYRALAAAQLALAGQGELADATAAVRAFMASRRSSFHVPQAIQLAGDLLGAGGDYAAARTEYAKLAKAKSPYYKLLSALLVGEAWQAEGKYDESLAEFDNVLRSPERGALFDPLKAAAALDRAVSQAGGGDAAEAARAIGEIIAKTDPEDASSLARAYNALGDCYLKAGDNQAALFAFLHVDLLYDDNADAHAKALHELVALWRAAGKDSRAQDAAQKLADKYPNSRWANN